MSDNQHCGKFAQIVADLQQANSGPVPIVDRAHYQRFSHSLASAVQEGGRFYLPIYSDDFSDSCASPEFRSLVRSPYDCITVLTRANNQDGDPTLAATIVFTRESLFNQKHKFIIDPIQPPGGGFYVAGVYQALGSAAFRAQPWLGFWGFDGNDGKMSIRQIRLPFVDEAQVKLYSPSGMCVRDSINTYANFALQLMVMVNLSNVHKQRVDPPAALNKKRLKNGKLPLYSYHVLKVDGEVWDRPETCGKGPGVRSHLRRGHVRRLHNSERFVWVRASFVRGSVPGFVAKDYDVVPALNPDSPAC